MRKVKVFWTSREKMELAIATKKEISSGIPLTVRLINEVINRIFPIERRRTIVSFSNVPELREMIAAIVESNTTNPTEKVSVGSCPSEVVIDQTSELVRLLVSMLSPVISRVVEQILKESIDTAEQILKGEHIYAKSNGETEKEEKIAKRKIVVVGMLNKEAARLEAEFSSIFNLKIYNHNQSINTLRYMLPSADVVLLSADNCTHSAEAMIKSKFPGKHIRIRGGYTTMRDELRSIAAS